MKFEFEDPQSDRWSRSSLLFACVHKRLVCKCLSLLYCFITTNDVTYVFH